MAHGSLLMCSALVEVITKTCLCDTGRLLILVLVGFCLFNTTLDTSEKKEILTERERKRQREKKKKMPQSDWPVGISLIND